MGRGSGLAPTQESMWPFSQKIARCLYCASFQKEAKVCFGYKNGTETWEHDCEVIENEKFS